MDLKSNTFYYRIAQINIVSIFILMMLGSYVKAIGAGLACPDWPLCHDQIIPVEYYGVAEALVMAEFIHRVFALFVSLVLFVLFYLSYLHRNELGANDLKIGFKRYRLMMIILLFLAIQVLFGGLTVLLKLEPSIVSIHLGVATFIFGASIFLLTWIDPNKSK